MAYGWLGRLCGPLIFCLSAADGRGFLGLRKPVLLTILDGWGYRAETHGNAIALARKPTYDKLLREYPNTLIRASEHFVGLPDGQMGNSEVGHLNLGAGRVVRMDITLSLIHI